jgi:hypothetical protein
MSDQSFNSSNGAALGPQRIEKIASVPGKKHPKKLKVRHLSELTKRIIIERYAGLMDCDEVASAMEIPGLTGRTVQNVLLASMLPTRKPPASEGITTMAGQRQRFA